MTIRAWRWWRVLEVDGTTQLWSWFIQCPWPEPTLRSEVKPDFDNESGIYGLKDRLPHCGYHVQCNPAIDNVHYLLTVGGWCHMWGRIIEHDAGYRAEYALVESLDHNVWLPNQDVRTNGLVPQILQQLQRTYGVELL